MTAPPRVTLVLMFYALDFLVKKSSFTIIKSFGLVRINSFSLGLSQNILKFVLWSSPLITENFNFNSFDKNKKSKKGV